MDAPTDNEAEDQDDDLHITEVIEYVDGKGRRITEGDPVAGGPSQFVGHANWPRPPQRPAGQANFQIPAALNIEHAYELFDQCAAVALDEMDARSRRRQIIGH